MIPVFPLDIVALLASVAAGIIVFAARKRALPGNVKILLTGLLLLTAFNNLSNFLEWIGIVATMEPLEDYPGVLTPIMWVFFLYAYMQWMTEQELHQTKESLQISEKKYRNLILQSKDAIFTVRTDGSISYASPACLDIFGYRQEEFMSDPELVVNILHPDYRSKFEDFWEEYSRMKKFPERSTEWEWIHKEGAVVYTENILSNIYNEEGEVVGFQTIARDITKRKKAEEELQMAHAELKRAYEELRSLEEVKRNVIANVSHELRTPITIIKGALELLVEEKDESERERLISIMHDAIIRQDTIVEDLVDASAMEKHVLKIRPEPLELYPLANSVVREFSPLAEKKEIALESKIGKRLPRVWADSKQLGHVLRNLLSNALKFTGEGGSVTLEGKCKKHMVEVCVADTGIGISREEQGKIFKRFYQVDSSRTRYYGGTGMGLAIIKEIVEQHGGRVTLQSEPGRGSCFCFTLPVAKK